MYRMAWVLGAMIFPGGPAVGGGPLSGWLGWAAVGTYVLIVLLVVGLFYVFSVAWVSPRSANRMFAPRLYIMAAWAISGAVSAVWSWYAKYEGPICQWSVLMSALFSVLLIPVIGERDAWGLRVRLAIPREGHAGLGLRTLHGLGFGLILVRGDGRRRPFSVLSWLKAGSRPLVKSWKRLSGVG